MCVTRFGSSEMPDPELVRAVPRSLDNLTILRSTRARVKKSSESVE